MTVLKLAGERLVKAAVSRQRPGTSIGSEVALRGDVHLAGESFVSGHAVLVAAVAGVVTPYLHGRWKILPWVLVVAVMVGRVYVGAHNPLGRPVRRRARRRHRRRREPAHRRPSPDDVDDDGDDGGAVVSSRVPVGTMTAPEASQVPPTVRRTRRRRRPSGAPPPLPRSIGAYRPGLDRRCWCVLVAWLVVALVSPWARRVTDQVDAAVAAGRRRRSAPTG